MRILGPHLGFNNLTDGWADLRDALKSIRALDQSDLTPSELEAINDLIRTIDRVLP